VDINEEMQAGMQKLIADYPVDAVMSVSMVNLVVQTSMRFAKDVGDPTLISATLTAHHHVISNAITNASLHGCSPDLYTKCFAAFVKYKESIQFLSQVPDDCDVHAELMKHASRFGNAGKPSSGQV
jgi:hypothetical protein